MDDAKSFRTVELHEMPRGCLFHLVVVRLTLTLGSELAQPRAREPAPHRRPNHRRFVVAAREGTVRQERIADFARDRLGRGDSLGGSHRLHTVGGNGHRSDHGYRSGG